MPRPLKRGKLGASTIILSKDIDKYAFMCGSNFNETDVTYIESCFIPVAFNSKPNFEGFKIHNFFMKIYEKWQNEFNIMLNV